MDTIHVNTVASTGFVAVIRGWCALTIIVAWVVVFVDDSYLDVAGNIESTADKYIVVFK